MNVVQELSDRDLHDYDVLVQTLDKQFDLASRVSSYRSRFHGQEDADTFEEELSMLCHCG